MDRNASNRGFENRSLSAQHRRRISSLAAEDGSDLEQAVAGWLRRETPLCYWRPGIVRNIKGFSMSVDAATVRRIAHLARIAVADDEVEHLKVEINAILAFVEQLAEVDVEGVEPMTSVTPMVMKERADVVTDGEIAADIVRNAPLSEGNFFLVPKVVE
jgi:aspartyl-tRNA(Asn)/glutamyl-tRNA(Gln) amidotransferase subunit C